MLRGSVSPGLLVVGWARAGEWRGGVRTASPHSGVAGGALLTVTCLHVRMLSVEATPRQVCLGAGLCLRLAMSYLVKRVGNLELV